MNKPTKLKGFVKSGSTVYFNNFGIEKQDIKMFQHMFGFAKSVKFVNNGTKTIIIFYESGCGYGYTSLLRGESVEISVPPKESVFIFAKIN